MATKDPNRTKAGKLNVRGLELDVDRIKARAQARGVPLGVFVIEACLNAKVVERPTIAQREPDLALMAEVDRFYRLLNKLGSLQKSLFDDPATALAARRHDVAIGAAIRDLDDAAKAAKAFFDDLNAKSLERAG